MRFSRGVRRRTLGIEFLECRRPLAGDVLASVYNGTLGLVADEEANAIEVRGTGNPGEVWITPSGGTTVNGGTAPILLSGVTDLNVTLNGGNDELYVKDFAFAGDGLILGDGGADTIRLGAWVAYGQAGTGDVSFGGKFQILLVLCVCLTEICDSFSIISML